MSSLRVVVVEDNDPLRDATVAMLGQAGFHVVGVASAEDLDDTPMQMAPDVYVIDLNLPGEDGLSLSKRLRQARPDVGIIITTARVQSGDRVMGYAVGADIYMPKPVDPAELLAALTALSKRVKRPGQSQDQRLTLLDEQLLFKGPWGEVRLADAEVRLLLAWVSAKEQTLERWQVMAQLNPFHDELSVDSLQNRISQLRRKLQACGAEGEVIKAVRGVGYRLCVRLDLK